MAVDIPYLCTVIGNLTGVPIRVYRAGEQIFYHSVVELPRDPICLYLDKILEIRERVGYFITPIFNYYGIVRSGEFTVVLGPARQIPAETQVLRELAFRADVPAVDTDDFILAMQNITRMPLDRVLQILLMVDHVLTGERLPLLDLKIYDAEQAERKTLLDSQTVSRESASAGEPDASIGNSYALEQTITNIVRHGDTASLRQWVANAPPVEAGILAHDQLRQYKNTFIVTATVICRSAIRGGMDVHDALALSDSYIQECELLTSMEAITKLHYHMALDYTERVERIRRGKQPTKLTIDVTNYVLHHLSEPIKTADIAAAVFMSRSRLSTKFKEEAGVTLTDYILKEKAIEGKRLLRYTDKTIISISEYLGFSSPAHFSRVFKKYIGVTPHEYRERKQ